MLRDRILSAVTVLIVLIPGIAFGGVIGVTLIVAVLACVAAWELSRVLPALNTSPSRELTIASVLVLAAAFYQFSTVGVLATVVAFPLIVLLAHLFLYNSVEKTIESSGNMILVSAYVSIPLGHAILLRRLDEGVAWVFFVIVLVSLGDVGAYFAGRYYGKHRFSKRVSPRKTVEGLVGGLCGNLLGMAVMKVLFSSLPSLSVLLPLALLLSVVGPLGDLVASAIKRRLEIKDFGAIMPGHGGIMDRADAHIPAFPTVYYFLVLTGAAVPT